MGTPSLRISCSFFVLIVALCTIAQRIETRFGDKLKEGLQTKIPELPKKFSVEFAISDLLKESKDSLKHVEYRRVWYDSEKLLARMDTFKGLKNSSELHDFNTGVTYSIESDQPCVIQPINGWFFKAHIGKQVIGHFKVPNEVLGLDGDFKYLGKKHVQGMYADVYESIQENVKFEKKKISTIRTTTYYSQDSYEMATGGHTESKFPKLIEVAGWNKKYENVLHKRFNVSAINDRIIPDMYDSFDLKSCFPSKNGKSHFIMRMNSDAEISALMEKQDHVILSTLRDEIVKITGVSHMRIPFLKADYASMSVYIQGLLLDRPPALKQFFDTYLGLEPFSIHDNDLKTAPSTVDTREKCAHACVDNNDFLCKGFVTCQNTCYLKSKDLMDDNNKGEKIHKFNKYCETWLRSVSDSSNREPYLADAMQRLQKAVLNGSFKFTVRIQEGDIIELTMKDVKFGDDVVTGAKLNAGNGCHDNEMECLQNCKTMGYGGGYCVTRIKSTCECYD